MYTFGSLTFTPDAYEADIWWAIDDNNIEYKITYCNGYWNAMTQRRIAFNSVSEGIGTFYSFEEAGAACADAALTAHERLQL